MCFQSKIRMGPWRWACISGDGRRTALSGRPSAAVGGAGAKKCGTALHPARRWVAWPRPSPAASSQANAATAARTLQHHRTIARLPSAHESVPWPVRNRARFPELRAGSRPPRQGRGWQGCGGRTPFPAGTAGNCRRSRWSVPGAFLGFSFTHL